MCELKEGIIGSPPTDDAAFRQKALATPHVKVAFQSLLISADGDRARARIKATAKEELASSNPCDFRGSLCCYWSLFRTILVYITCLPALWGPGRAVGFAWPQLQE